MNLRTHILGAAAALLLATSGAVAQFPRTVIIEEFTSVTCKPCTTASKVLNDLLVAHPERVITVRNQVDFVPSPNPYATPQTEARKAYYEVPALPNGRLDGTNIAVTDANQVFPRVEDRLLIEAPIKIDVTSQRSGNVFNVSVHITSEADLDTDYKLHLIAIERTVTDPSILQINGNNGETVLHDVVRSMVTSIEGSDITLTTGEEQTLPFTVPIGETWNADEIYFVAFVQNGTTKEIVQGGYSARPVSGIRPTAVRPGYAVGASIPTPAVTTVTIPFTLASPSPVLLRIVDMLGRDVARLDGGMTAAGDGRITLDLEGIAPGSYVAIVEADGLVGTTPVVVTR